MAYTYDANGNVTSAKDVHGQTTTYQHTNNNLTKEILPTGAALTYTYDAWGNPLTTSGTLATTLGTLNPLRYRGYVYDTETGFYYLQSRYYDPEVGRFINADALVSTGQGILGNNMFAYCNNTPVNGSDPCGTCFYNKKLFDDCDYCDKLSDGEKFYQFVVGFARSYNKTKKQIEEVTDTISDSINTITESGGWKIHNGIKDIAFGAQKVVSAVLLLVAPVPTPAEDVAGVAKATHGILQFSGGITKIVIGINMVIDR